MTGATASAPIAAEAFAGRHRSDAQARLAGVAYGSRYRPDIDGLRAISVMSVVLFHMAPRYLPAGGIGVDIFLVISGYLIGGIILTSLDEGRWSFADFYLRRVRRIIPAFLLVNAVSLALATFLFFPNELLTFAASGLSALICASNIFFFRTTDYFGDTSSAPLLHTWTLGVEEQFYFLFPFLAIGIHKCTRDGRGILGLLALMLLASLLASEIAVVQNKPAAFYLLHSRAWELMVGVVAARLPASRMPARAATMIGVAGLGLIAVSLLLLRPEAGFPGIAAIPPVLGAAMFIHSGVQAPAAPHRLLALAPLRLVGLASYSIYLWHWPIIIFVMRWLMIGKLTVPAMAVALFLSIACGFLSWRFVEAPFRSPAMSARRLLATCSILAAAVAAAYVAIIATAGLPSRITPRALRLAAWDRMEAGFTLPVARCHLAGDAPVAEYDRAACLTPQPGKQNWLLLGDSHAAMLYGTLQRRFAGVHVLPALALGCSMPLDPPASSRGCDGLLRMILADYLPGANIQGVILTSRWGQVDEPGIERLRTMLRARGIQLLLIGPTPDFSMRVPRILAEAERWGDPTLPARALESRVWSLDAQLRRFAARTGIAYASPLSAMCRDRLHCIVADRDGIPLYNDASHYTDHGAAIMIERLRTIDAATGRALARTLLARP